jgi:manganese oxidase
MRQGTNRTRALLRDPGRQRGMTATFAVLCLISSCTFLGGGCGNPDDQQSQSEAARHGSAVEGLKGTSFTLTARSGFISVPDGGSIFTWGYADGSGLMQYPGPTLVVEQGEEITVTLNNELPLPVSIVFPGQQTTASGGADGVLTREAPPGGTVTYSFRATNAGTYLYHSGTRPELQVEMGLMGALIVRPYLGDRYAYDHASTAFDREYLFLLSEMDPRVHAAAAVGAYDTVDPTDRWPVYWFINGRSAPDTMAEDHAPWLPHQPYSAMPQMHPGERVLMRLIGGGRDLHPFHHHGNHARVIAHDGRLLESAPGQGPDLSYLVFTLQTSPGETKDAIFEWTGKGLGWDIYGDLADHPHDCTDSDGDGLDDRTKEYCADHGKPIPVALPDQQSLTVLGNYPGSPYLGVTGPMPPGSASLNPSAAYPFMWHSHTEKEMTNDDIFPGGMMTMMFIEAPDMPIM